MLNYSPYVYKKYTHVNRDGVDGVVNLEPNKEEGTAQVDPTSNNADAECGPGLNSRARGGDSDEASETSIHGTSEVVSDDASPALIN